MKRVLLASAFMAVAALTGGCCEFHRFVHTPFGPGTLCDPTHCGDCGSGPCDPCDSGPCGFGPTGGCGPAACCEPRCAPGAGCGDCCGLADGCGTSCAPCGDCGPCYDACGDGCCTCGCCGPGPVYYLARLFHPMRWFGCYNNGCGEMYWGDFHGDPPDCCDPCDRMGNFTGRTSGACGGECSDCGCGAPVGDYATPSGGYTTPKGVAPLQKPASSDGEIDPSRMGEPTKAPVVPKAAFYSGRRPQSRQPQQRQMQKYPYPYRPSYRR